MFKHSFCCDDIVLLKSNFCSIFFRCFFRMNRGLIKFIYKHLINKLVSEYESVTKDSIDSTPNTEKPTFIFDEISPQGLYESLIQSQRSKVLLDTI